MAIENGCHTITAQNIVDGSATISTTHTSVAGEATCQTQRPKPPIYGVAPQLAAAPNPNPVKVKPLGVTVSAGDLVIDVKGLNEGERICWLSDDGV